MWAKLPPRSSLGSGGDVHVALVLHPVDVGGDPRRARHDRRGILVHRIPVLHLLHALVVALHEHRFALHDEDGGGEHGHGVRVARHRAQHVDHVLGKLGAGLEVLHHLERLRHGGDVAGEQEVPEALHVGILAAGHLGQGGEGLRDGLAAETNPLQRVEVGNVGHQALHVAGPADGLVDGDLADLHLPVLLHSAVMRGRCSSIFFNSVCFSVAMSLTPFLTPYGPRRIERPGTAYQTGIDHTESGRTSPPSITRFDIIVPSRAAGGRIMTARAGFGLAAGPPSSTS